MGKADMLLDRADSYRIRWGVADDSYRNYMLQYYKAVDPDSAEAKDAAQKIAESFLAKFGEGNEDYLAWLEKAK